MVSEISPTDLLYVELKKNEHKEQIGCCQRQRVGKISEGGQKVQIWGYKINKFWGFMYSLVNLVNNTVFYSFKLLIDQVLKVLITRKKLQVCEEMSVSLTYY